MLILVYLVNLIQMMLMIISRRVGEFGWVVDVRFLKIDRSCLRDEFGCVGQDGSCHALFAELGSFSLYALLDRGLFCMLFLFSLPKSRSFPDCVDPGTVEHPLAKNVGSGREVGR